MLLLNIIACSSGADTSVDDGSGSLSGSVSLEGSPFADELLGDDFEWGVFIRSDYQTATVESLPLPIFLAYFTEDEIVEVEAGIDIANDAVGFDVFEVVDTWTDNCRVIYKVSQIDFEEEGASSVDPAITIGYTYNRNSYINDKYDAGRVVLDWAIEIQEDNVSKYVVAHELGHAMGIQKHELIDYDNDTTEELEDNSLMSSSISSNPELDEYNYMMHMQGELLLEYMEQYGFSID